jgi:hypothetical protein
MKKARGQPAGRAGIIFIKVLPQRWIEDPGTFEAMVKDRP